MSYTRKFPGLYPGPCNYIFFVSFGLISMMRKLHILVILGILLGARAFALNKDSLVQAIKTMRPDTNKVQALYELATHNDLKDTSAAMSYANQMLALARELKYVKGAAKAWQAMGVIQFYARNFKRSIYFFEKGVLAYKEAPYPRGSMICYHWLARCHRRLADYTAYGKYLASLENLANDLKDEEYLSYAYEGHGNLYRYLGDYPRSIENYIKAINIAEKRGDLNDLSVALNNLSLVYGILGQSAEELKIELRTYKVTQQLKDSANMVLCLGNLSSIYESMRKMDTAQMYCDLAMKIIRSRGEETLNFKDVASVYGQHANLLAAKKDLLLAVEFYNKAINLSKTNQDIKSVASGYASLAGVFILMNNRSMAEEYYLKALDINKNIGFLNGQMMNYQSLEDLYKFLKKDQKAVEVHKQYTLLNDSLERMTSTRKLAGAEALYKINEHREELARLEKERKIQELEQEKKTELIYAVAGGLSLLLVVGIMIFLKRGRKKEPVV